MAKCSDDLIASFDAFKAGKLADVSYLKLRLVDDAHIEVVERGAASLTFGEVCARALRDDEACWLLTFYRYRCVDGGRRAKLVLVPWIPSLSTKTKMVYAMSTGVVKRACQGVNFVVQANGRDDVTDAAVLARVSRFEREKVASLDNDNAAVGDADTVVTDNHVNNDIAAAAVAAAAADTIANSA